MKRLISLILSVIICTTLVLSMVSCDRETLETFNGMEPEQLYYADLLSLEGMDNYEIVHEQTITATAFFFIKSTVNQTVTVHIDGDNFYQNIECDTEGVWSEDSVLECWYVDEYFYANHTGKIRKQYEAAYNMNDSSIYNFDNADGTLLNIPESWLKDTTFFSEDDEVYIEFIIDGEQYYDFLFDAGGDTTYAELAVGDVCYRVYFHENGVVDRIHSSFNYIDNSTGVNAEVSIEINTKITNVGNTTITLPAGAENAEEGRWFYIY